MTEQKPTRKTYSTEEKETILQDIKNGMTQSDVAKKHGVSIQTIGNWLKDNKSEPSDDRKVVSQTSELIEDKLIEFALKDKKTRKAILNLIINPEE